MGLRKPDGGSEKTEAVIAVRALQPSPALSLRMSRRPLALVSYEERSDFDLEDGRRLELRSSIGSGSGSTVYRAVIESPFGLRRNVAAKMFGVVGSDDADNVYRVIGNAAQRSAFVEHPNVVSTFDYLVCEGQPLILLEHVDGANLGVLMARYAETRRRMPLELAVFIALEVAEGLSGARSARDADGMQLGLLHLGLTPREILLSWRGEVKVEGFGLDVAKVGTSSVRSLRGFSGRAGMMAPEVACGVPGDARADVFSVGMLLRELLVGPRFPAGISNAESIRRARDGYLHPIAFAPQLPGDLAQLMTRALSIEADLRFPSASAMVYELRRIALNLGIGDARFFLRQALDRELKEGLDDDTHEWELDLVDDQD